MIVTTHLDFVSFYFSSILPAFRLCSNNNGKDNLYQLSAFQIDLRFLKSYELLDLILSSKTFFDTQSFILTPINDYVNAFFAIDWRIIYIMNKEKPVLFNSSIFHAFIINWPFHTLCWFRVTCSLGMFTMYLISFPFQCRTRYINMCQFLSHIYMKDSSAIHTG